MTDQKDEAKRRETAALWYTELQNPDVSPDTWEAFLEWEKDPANAAAYREIESLLGLLDRTSLGGPASANPGRGRKSRFRVVAEAQFLVDKAVSNTISSLDHAMIHYIHGHRRDPSPP